MASSSSAKPMSSISSASSSTTASTCPRSRVRRRMWSRARPGVATTTSTPRRRPPSCCVIDCAAVDGHHARAQAAAVAVDGLGHLHGQLARGDEHEDARRPCAWARPRGFAARSAARRRRSCRCRWPPVPRGRARPGGGIASLLDRRRLLVAELPPAPTPAWGRGRGRGSGRIRPSIGGGSSIYIEAQDGERVASRAEPDGARRLGERPPNVTHRHCRPRPPRPTSGTRDSSGRTPCS